MPHCYDGIFGEDLNFSCQKADTARCNAAINSTYILYKSERTLCNIRYGFVDVGNSSASLDAFEAGGLLLVCFLGGQEDIELNDRSSCPFQGLTFVSLS